MNTNQLQEHVRKLNELEAVEHELKRQKALKRIQELREELKYKNKEKSNGAFISERI